ncbi:hypothetical protein BDB01DRAFT_793975 [Pilobolus umbonatus]|nr:hypothetical protein BDB01DRAFT_793975 [Pilobolus umbonatus]
MDAVSVNIETADPSSNRVISDPIEEQVKLFRFDYKSLPKEVKSLVDEYDRKGKVKRRVVEVIDREEDMEDDDLLDDDEDEDDEDNQLLDDHAVHYRSVIKGITNDYRERGDEMKELAIVSTTRSDNLEFTKLVQVPTNDDTENGHLLDLHVSLFGVDNTDHTNNKHNEEQFDDLLKSVEVQLQSVLNLKLEYVKCFADYQNSISELDLESDTHDASLLRANSFSTLPSRSPRINDPYGPSGSINSIVSAGIIASPMNDNLINKKTAKKRNFHDKTMKARWLINASKKELREFTQALKRTEDTMNNIQIEMESTKNKVDTNIKDIPESHNLTLKLLEEDIEFILNRRAKNPWLDTGYAILSYVLTFCALVVWIVIYMLKLGKRVLLFPHRLWMTYTEYMAERKKIKEAKHEEDDGYLMSRPLNMGIRVPSVTIESDELRNRRVYT